MRDIEKMGQLGTFSLSLGTQEQHFQRDDALTRSRQLLRLVLAGSGSVRRPQALRTNRKI